MKEIGKILSRRTVLDSCDGRLVPNAPCSNESQGRHFSHAQSRVDRTRHLFLSRLCDDSPKVAV